MQKPKVIAIVGPTGTGKTALGNFLAKKFDGETISADSRQIYRGMFLISRAEQGHMVELADPKRQYSAGEYTRISKKILGDIAGRGKLPIVVGGTGFYADALLRGLSLPEVPPNKKLRSSLSHKSSAQLLHTLKKLDPKSAERVDPHNKVRLVRAIEIAKALGMVPALTQRSDFKVLWLGLRPKANYTQVLKKGVEQRIRRGMLAEAKALRNKLSKRRFGELGFEFSHLANYLDKKISKKELIENLVRAEEKYAKRQMRWFRRNHDIVWVQNKTEAQKRAAQFIKF